MFMFDCPTINQFWEKIDKKWKNIINSNEPFKLSFKQIVLLFLEGNLTEQEKGGKRLLYLFIVEAVQIIRDYRRNALDNEKTFSPSNLYVRWLEAIQQRIKYSISSFVSIPYNNANKVREKENRKKEILKT